MGERRAIERVVEMPGDPLSRNKRRPSKLFYLQNKSYKEIETITGLDGNRSTELYSKWEKEPEDLHGKERVVDREWHPVSGHDDEYPMNGRMMSRPVNGKQKINERER